jgi:FG-GAP repeat/Putative metal-binding motif
MRTSASALALFALSCAADLDEVPANAGDPAASAAPQHSSDLQALVAADRRQLQAVGPGRFTASPRFGLTAELTADGLRASSNDDTVALVTVGYGNVEVGGAEPELGGCAPDDERIDAACVRQVELDHGDITEWWVSRANGLEHGWTLHAPPEDGPVSITVALSQGEVLEVDNDGAGASLVGSAGGLWRYDGLVAWDADGVVLPARLVDDGPQLTVEVDVAGARWPVTVDPVLSTETKLTASDAKATAVFGGSVSGAGDLNGDGYDDLVVGAYGDVQSGIVSGSAYVYYGSATGINSASEDKLAPSDGEDDDNFGLSVSSAGDIDGDGYDDLVVGAPAQNEAGTNSGSAYVYYGSSTGIDGASEDKLAASDAVGDNMFGSTVSGAGDLNGDGYDDLVVSAPGDDDNGSYSGTGYVYYGSAAGIDSASEDKLTASDGAVSDYFGWSVSDAGDLDGDGYDDLVVGAERDSTSGNMSGAAYVYYGSATGIDSALEVKLTASDAATYDIFGCSVSGAGDLDGDGYDDLVVGSYWDDDAGSNSGSAYVYFSSAAGIDSASEDKLIASDGASDDSYGLSVSGAGDLDGDGYDDLVVGAFYDDDGSSKSGSAYVYGGGCRELDGDADGDGYLCDVDCDGSDATTYPGAAFAESTTDCMTDKDGDGYGDDSPAGGVTAGTDCDDGDATISPAATFEGVDDEVDQDCDGSETCNADSDDDGFIDGTTTVASADIDCTDAGEGLATAQTGECDDSDASTYPGAAAADSATDCMTDDDGDGYGDDSPASGVTAGTDCDDGDAAFNPGATEVVGDEVDQDCDGTEACAADADDDGYVDGTTTVASTDTDCTDAGEGLASDPTGDCDDTDSTVYPGATEVEDDGIDQDCDGEDAEAEAEAEADEPEAEVKGGCASTGVQNRTGLLVLAAIVLIGLRRRDGAVAPGRDAESSLQKAR